MNIEIHPKTAFKYLLYLITFLLFANCLGLLSNFYFGHDHVYGLVPLFALNVENNVPTFYSSCALLVSSVLLLFIAIRHKKSGGSFIPWFGLSAIFLFLSIDEIASIHESLIDPMKETFNTSGLLFFSWVIPYSIGLIVFVIAYAKFLINLPRNTMILFITSGAIFVGGAIGIELFEGREAELHGFKTLAFALYYTAEEFLEMLGIVIFIYTLLSYITTQFSSLTISIKEQA